MTLVPTWQCRTLSRLQPNRPKGRRRFCAVNSEQSDELRRGGFAAPSIMIPKGGGGLWPPEPKKRDTHCVSLFLCVDVTNDTNSHHCIKVLHGIYTKDFGF